MGAAALNKIDFIGRIFLNKIHYTFHLFLTFYLAIRETFSDQTQGARAIFSVVSAQVYFTGWKALPLISMLAIASGGIIVLQTFAHLTYVGGADVIGNILVGVLVREVAPFVTALIVIARSGTAVATELGNLRVNREIDALESMGINPMSYIVFPRIVGGMISVLCLTFYFIMIAFVAGFFLTHILENTSLDFYFNSIMMSFTTADIFLFLSKSIFSGILIFVVSCYHGLQVKKSPTEVPGATTKAVVNCVIYVVVFNLSVSTLFYINQLMKLGVG